MSRKILECRHILPARPSARERRAAGALTGAAVLAACVLATTAAAPAAGHRPSPARHAFHAAATAAVPGWIRIAAGGDHTCGIREGNTLWCWGAAQYGELGTGATLDQDLPQQITKPTTGWASVTAGYYHSCATRSDTTLWCWGRNNDGQLGIGNTTNVGRPHQVTTPAATGWATVTGGHYHTCATRTDTTLWCWGRNNKGQLGTGTGISGDLPQQVTGPEATGWATVATGGFHTCATRTDTTLWCWGYNSLGELGDGSTWSEYSPEQVTTPAANGWASVAAGDYHTCATRTDTTMWCWGDNYYGQLGIGFRLSQDLPQQVTIPAPDGWTTVTAGDFHTCALRTHALRCWGYNGDGELGIGYTTNANQPHQVGRPPAVTGWSHLTTGGSHTCATHTGHTLWCWGYNGFGQLGIGTTVAQDLPQQVTS